MPTILSNLPSGESRNRSGGIAVVAAAFAIAACAGPAARPSTPGEFNKAPYIVVLGVAQDGSHPQAGCDRACCKRAWEHPSERHYASSLSLVDPRSHKRWIFDATPDLPAQLHTLQPEGAPSPIVTGVFLTHGHIGHYAGLMHLGREVMGTSGIDVFAMPRMQAFLETNGPWSQLVKLRNIVIVPMLDHQEVMLADDIKVIPMLVPHRDEYTETVGFSIRGPHKRVLYIPDIDKWEKWSSPIESVIAEHDDVFIDGTFFSAGELRGRTMAEVPHPFIAESMARLSKLSERERAKVRFIHLNHTNPALDSKSAAAEKVRAQGFALAAQGDVISL